MIFQISGKLVHILDDSIVLDVQGVGYHVFIPDLLRNKLPSIGDLFTVFTYHLIREDNQQLFGFESLVEKQLFLTLISVSGVGPKVAIKILSSCDSGMLIQSILKEDLVTLTRIPGLGKKTAERLIVELKDKLEQFHTITMPTSTSPNIATSTSHSQHQDVMMALKTLGYHAEEVRRAIRSASEQLHADMKLEERIKVLLKHL